MSVNKNTPQRRRHVEQLVFNAPNHGLQSSFCFGTAWQRLSHKDHVCLDSLRGSCVNIGTKQRRLAWPLRKDDTHKSRGVNILTRTVRAKGSCHILTLSVAKVYLRHHILTGEASAKGSCLLTDTGTREASQLRVFATRWQRMAICVYIYIYMYSNYIISYYSTLSMLYIYIYVHIYIYIYIHTHI